MDPREPQRPPDPARPSPEDAPTIDSGAAAAARGDDAPTLDATRAPGSGSRPLPESIGGYRIVGRLGEGGMGLVFEAEQQQPRRRVALKVIRGGMFLDEQHVRMFQREVDTLARLKHPNIAAIYDAGRTEAGEHFFAMELVRGRTLDRYLRERPPLDRDELRFRLRLFRSICLAVAYAHQRGVIHRDLKPSNIVVADVEDATETATASRSGDGLPAVKVLDFGLARITASDVEVASAVSEIGVIKGTLPYMSPEQAQGNPDEIDLRSDVYALGVILYEMLTGSRPYDIQNTSIVEAVRIITEQPPAPLKQSWSGVHRPDTDLQTIVGKALEKEADRRYDSASALAEDVERYLESRPILARAPSTMYQLGKFARRNRTLVAGVLATLVALVAGIVATTIFGIREAAQRRQAETAQHQTQTIADFQTSMLGEIDAPKMGQRLADDLAARYEKARREKGASAREVAASLGVFKSSLAEINSTDAALRVIDENILAHAITSANQQFGTQPLVRAQLLASIGQTYLKLGILDKAESSLVASRAVYAGALGPRAVPTLEADHRLATLYASEQQTPKAEPLLGSALAGLRQTLPLRDPEVLSTMNDLAMLYGDTGRYQSAESLYAITLAEQRRLKGDRDPYTLTVMSNYAWALTNDEKYAQAESLGILALAGRRAVLGNENSETMTSVNNLGVLYMRTNRPERAEPLYVEDYEMTRRLEGDEHPDVLVSMTNLGRLYNRRHKYPEAEAILAKALATSKRVLPPGFFGTGVTSLAYSEALVGLGRLRDAEPHLLEAHRILLAVADPHDRGVQRAVTLLVQVYEQTGRAAEAAHWRTLLDPAK